MDVCICIQMLITNGNDFSMYAYNNIQLLLCDGFIHILTDFIMCVHLDFKNLYLDYELLLSKQHMSLSYSMCIVNNNNVGVP